MKIFGGKKASDQNASNQQRVSTPYDQDPSYDVMGGSGGGGKPPYQQGGDNKKPPEEPSKGSIILLIIAIFAFLLAGAAFIAVQLIKPPEVVVHENDKTIIDKENGDAVVIDPGQRISDYFTFLVCATDIDETRTDNMMVVGFDTKNHKVNVLNLPRDIMCSNNKTGANRKINAAYGSNHNIENTMKEVKKVIGFTPDKYIVVSFNGIAQIVDTIGGIDYEIPFKMIYNDPYQDLHIYFEPGLQHLNGEQVVEFLRWRHNDPGYTHLQTEGYDGGDESRIAKQQEFLMYLAKQILTPSNILKAKPIAEAVFNNVKTDLTMGELVWMANQAMQVDSANIQMFTLPGYPASSYAGSDAYLSFFFPNEQKTIDLINQYFNPYDKPISALDVIESPPEGKRRPNVSTEEDEPEIQPPPEITQKPEGEANDQDPEVTTPEEELPNQGETDGQGSQQTPSDGENNNQGNGNTEDTENQPPDNGNVGDGQTGNENSDQESGTDDTNDDMTGGTTGDTTGGSTTGDTAGNTGSQDGTSSDENNDAQTGSDSNTDNGQTELPANGGTESNEVVPPPTESAPSGGSAVNDPEA